MKNTLRLFGILAITAMIGFSMTACGGGGNGNDAPPPPPPPGTNGDNGAVPDPDNPAWAHTFDPPFVTTIDMFRSPMINAVVGRIVGDGSDYEEFLWGPIDTEFDDTNPSGPRPAPPSFNRVRWAPPPAGAPAGSMTMHIFGRTHDYDGVWINFDELSAALQGEDGPYAEWSMPLLGHGRDTELVRCYRLVITGRVDTVSAYGNRNIELVRCVEGNGTFEEVQLLAEARISSDPRAGATGEVFELTWNLTYAPDSSAGAPAGAVVDGEFGFIGIITRGWAGNNLHASGIADIFVDSVGIQRAAARALAVSAGDVTRVTEGVLVRAGRSMDGQNTPRPGIEVLIMPQRDGMGEIHRGITFAFASDSGAGPGNHLQVGDWRRFGWVSVVIPEYANHELDNHHIPMTPGRDSWDRGNISLRVAHGWDYGSEGNYLGGNTTGPASIPGWDFDGATVADRPISIGMAVGALPLGALQTGGVITDIHGFWLDVDGDPEEEGPGLVPLFPMEDIQATPQGLRQQGRVLSIPMEYIHNQGRIPARGGVGGLSIFSGDTAATGVDQPSQNFSLVISHIVFHDGPFHTRFLGDINF